MAPHEIVVLRPVVHDPVELGQCLGVLQQRAILGLEAPEETLDAGIVPGPLQGVGDPGSHP